MLEDLPWRTQRSEALRHARELISAPSLPQDLNAWMSVIGSVQIGKVIDHSIERSTHFKWFLGASLAGYIVWLHEYRAPERFAQAVSFAASVHDHRYGFCSRVLSGALHVSAFALLPDSESLVESVGCECVQQGETMLLSSTDIHRIDCVEPHTYTIVIQGPADRGYSTCYDLTTGRAQRMYDLRTRFPKTLGALSQFVQAE